MHHKWLGSWLAKCRLPQHVGCYLHWQMIAWRQMIGKRMCSFWKGQWTLHWGQCNAICYHWPDIFQSPKILMNSSWKILTTLGAPHAVTPLEMKLWNHDGTWKTKGWSCSMIAACSWGQQFITDDSFFLFHRWPPTSNPTSSYPSSTVVRQARSLMARTYCWIPFAKLFERYIIINVAKMGNV